jgi:hypothetical protein
MDAPNRDHAAVMSEIEIALHRRQEIMKAILQRMQKVPVLHVKSHNVH